MAAIVEELTTRPLSLTDELILVLLNEQNGYFHQVPGWDLNCAVVGAVLAELSLLSRIDTDMEALHLVDATETGDPALDPVLKEIAEEPDRRNAQYWIERLVLHAESVIDLDFGPPGRSGHPGTSQRRFLYAGFDQTARDTEHGSSREGTAGQFIKARIGEVILTDSIPHPRDVIVISLVNTCDVLRFIFELDEEAERRIETICRMDLIGRSIADAVRAQHRQPPAPAFHPDQENSEASRCTGCCSARILRTGNVPALFAELTERYGPVFQDPSAVQETYDVRRRSRRQTSWVHRHGRMYLRARDYFADFEKIYGASGVLPSLDGTDHFRLRKALSPGLFAREAGGADWTRFYHHGRNFMADWKVGDALPATQMSAGG